MLHIRRGLPLFGNDGAATQNVLMNGTVDGLACTDTLIVVGKGQRFKNRRILFLVGIIDDIVDIRGQLSAFPRKACSIATLLGNFDSITDFVVGIRVAAVARQQVTPLGVVPFTVLFYHIQNHLSTVFCKNPKGAAEAAP